MTTSQGRAACILGCEGHVLSARETAFFRAADPWGFILFARNIETPDQLRRLTGELRDAVGWNAPILIDQEGGRVQRLRAPHWREWLPPLDMVTLDRVVQAGPDQAAEAMRLRYRIIASELRAVGIDVNCAPTADIAGPHTHPFLKNRCYGETMDTVVRLSRAVADGLLAGGVLPVMKHMPGHGRATADTHHDLPTVSESADVLGRSDFAVFRALSDLPLGMTAHIVFSSIDPEAPATLSRRMVRVIREDISFRGLLMTDDLSMRALSGTIGARTAAARAAGCDLALHCNGEITEMEVVADTAGVLDADAMVRSDAALALRASRDEVDIAGLEAKLSLLLNGQ